MDLKEVVSFGLRLTAAATISMLSIKYILDHDMFQTSSKKDKREVAELLKRMSISPGRDLDLTEHEIRIALQLVESTDGVQWEDVGGVDELIQDLKDRLILPLEFCENVGSSTLMSPPRGVLLYGPPGCGKTLLAKAIANAAKCRFINLQVSSLTDKWYGESQKLASAVFSIAKKLQPAIIFIDEIDSFLRDRQSFDHESTAMMKAQFMQHWDGFNTSNDMVIVMGATNRPNDIDPAIRRRMPARFLVPLPGIEQAVSIFKIVLREVRLANDVDLEQVALLARQLSGSDIKEVCRMAYTRRVRKTLKRLGRSPDVSYIESRETQSSLRCDPLEQGDLTFAITMFNESTSRMSDFIQD